MASAVCAALQNDRFATKRELNNLTLLAADSAKIFPPDFASVTPQDVATAAQVHRQAHRQTHSQTDTRTQTQTHTHTHTQAGRQTDR